MYLSIRAVSPRINSRCPQCHCFVRIDAGTCTACGYAFTLASDTRRAETRPFEAQVLDCQSGPKGNAHAFSNLQPDGKIIKPPKRKTPHIDQMNLFQGVL